MAVKRCIEEGWIGTVTVGERGQIVIPAEARKKLEINHGDTLVAMGHPNGEGIMLFKIGAMKEFLAHLTEGLNLAEQTTPDVEAHSEDMTEHRR